ncbi:hypothetical protein CB1_000537015 [Camelus ferus]|nr:hypothetical protein CB1_000537015 [Camelus ferus]
MNLVFRGGRQEDQTQSKRLEGTPATSRLPPAAPTQSPGSHRAAVAGPGRKERPEDKCRAEVQFSLEPRPQLPPPPWVLVKRRCLTGREQHRTLEPRQAWSPERPDCQPGQAGRFQVPVTHRALPLAHMPLFREETEIFGLTLISTVLDPDSFGRPPVPVYIPYRIWN